MINSEERPRFDRRGNAKLVSKGETGVMWLSVACTKCGQEGILGGGRDAARNTCPVNNKRTTIHQSTAISIRPLQTLGKGNNENGERGKRLQST